MIISRETKPLLIAGLFLGIGMGGFVDGILFHQILQAHAMLSNILLPDTLVNIQINMFWDGLFHAFTWSMTLIGIILLWRFKASQQSANLSWILFGAALIGFGLFNVVEGTIDHLVLHLHHVIQRASTTMQYFSDILFLISGIVLILIGRKCLYKELEPESVVV